MIELVSLGDAKEHLRQTGTRFDSDLQFKILQASDIVLNYLKINMDASPIVFPWTGDIPFGVQAACLLVLGDLSRYREGTQPQTQASTDFDPISPAVKSLLNRWRDPTLA
jgi:hypothetical protein